MESHLKNIFEELFDQASDLILIMTPSKKIEFMNKNAAKLLQGSLTSSNHLKIDEQSQDRWNQYVENIHENFKESCMLSVQTSSGRYINIKLHSYYIPDQDLIFSRVATPSITSLEPVQSLANQPINQMIQSIAHGVILTSLNGTILTANPVALQLLDQQLWQIENRSHDSLFLGLDQNDKDVIEYYQKLANKETATLKVSKLNGNKLSYYFIESKVDTLLNLIITTIIDETEKITLLNKLDHQDSLHLIGQNIASIAHELRNPMTSLNGFLQLLKDNLDSDSNRFFEIMESELLRMDLLLEGLLTFSKPKLLQFESFCLLGIIQEVIDLLQVQAIMSNTLIEFEYSKLEDYSIYGNKARLKQMVINLVKNAIEAIDTQGKVTIKLMTQYTGKLTLIISDEGVGMDQQTIENLFNPYYTTKSGGTGLGLMFVKKVVEEHDGEIMLCTDVGCGTQFKLVFNQHNTSMNQDVKQLAFHQNLAPKLSYS